MVATLGTISHSRRFLFLLLSGRLGSRTSHFRQLANQRALGSRHTLSVLSTPLVEGGDGGGGAGTASGGCRAPPSLSQPEDGLPQQRIGIIKVEIMARVSVVCRRGEDDGGMGHSGSQKSGSDVFGVR